MLTVLGQRGRTTGNHRITVQTHPGGHRETRIGADGVGRTDVVVDAVQQCGGAHGSGPPHGITVHRSVPLTEERAILGIAVQRPVRRRSGARPDVEVVGRHRAAQPRTVHALHVEIDRPVARGRDHNGRVSTQTVSVHLRRGRIGEAVDVVVHVLDTVCLEGELTRDIHPAMPGVVLPVQNTRHGRCLGRCLSVDHECGPRSTWTRQSSVAAVDGPADGLPVSVRQVERSAERRPGRQCLLPGHGLAGGLGLDVPFRRQLPAVRVAQLGLERDPVGAEVALSVAPPARLRERRVRGHRGGGVGGAIELHRQLWVEVDTVLLLDVEPLPAVGVVAVLLLVPGLEPERHRIPALVGGLLDRALRVHPHPGGTTGLACLRRGLRLGDVPQPRRLAIPGRGRADVTGEVQVHRLDNRFVARVRVLPDLVDPKVSFLDLCAVEHAGGEPEERAIQVRARPLRRVPDSRHTLVPLVIIAWREVPVRRRRVGAPHQCPGRLPGGHRAEGGIDDEGIGHRWIGEKALVRFEG